MPKFGADLEECEQLTRGACRECCWPVLTESRPKEYAKRWAVGLAVNQRPMTTCPLEVVVGLVLACGELYKRVACCVWNKSLRRKRFGGLKVCHGAGGDPFYSRIIQLWIIMAYSVLCGPPIKQYKLCRVHC